MMRTIVFSPGKIDLEISGYCPVQIHLLPFQGLTNDQIFVLDVEMCFDELNDREKACAILLYGECMTLRQAAKKLNMDHKSVCWWRDKGLEKLGETLEDKRINMSNKQWLRYIA
jgi:hypothetical protein